jgi:hypothetical protein
MAMMMLWRHPKPSALADWLHDGESGRIGRHVAGCERCLAAMEDLSDLDETMRSDLSDALSTPMDLEERTARQLERRLREEAALTVFFELFATGWSTTTTLIDSEEDNDV